MYMKFVGAVDLGTRNNQLDFRIDSVLAPGSIYQLAVYN